MSKFRSAIVIIAGKPLELSYEALVIPVGNGDPDHGWKSYEIALYKVQSKKALACYETQEGAVHDELLFVDIIILRKLYSKHLLDSLPTLEKLCRLVVLGVSANPSF